MAVASLANKSNKSNKSSRSGISERYDYESDWVSSLTLSDALVSTRDGIIGTDTIDDDEVKRRLARWDALPADELERFMMLDAEWRAAVLDSRLLEDLTVQPDGPSAEKAVVWYRDGASGQARPLISVTKPGNEQFVDQLKPTRSYVDLRPERLSEIDVQCTQLLPFFASIDRLDPLRTRHTLELLALAERISTVVVQRLKFMFNCPRPADISSQIQPMIATPTHGTFPHGHATQAYMLAALLTWLVDGDDAEAEGTAFFNQRYQLAARIAINRVVAGVHFPVDCACGAILGYALAEWLAARAGVRPVRTRTFDRTTFDGDFHYGVAAELLAGQLPAEEERAAEEAAMTSERAAAATSEASDDALASPLPAEGDPGAEEPATTTDGADDAVPTPSVDPLVESLWKKASSEWSKA